MPGPGNVFMMSWLQIGVLKQATAKAEEEEMIQKGIGVFDGAPWKVSSETFLN